MTLHLVEDEVPQERKGPRLALWRAERRQTLRLERDIQEGEDQRHALVRVEVGLLQPAVDGGRDRGVRLSGGHATELAHEVRHRQIRRGTAIGQTVSLQIQHRSPNQTAAEFRQQPRFAHAGLAHDGDDLPLSRHHRVESLLQQRQLRVEGTGPRAVADNARPLVGDPPDTVYEHRRLGRAERTSPRGSARTCSWTRCCVAALSGVVPGAASCRSRSATCVVSPAAV